MRLPFLLFLLLPSLLNAQTLLLRQPTVIDKQIAFVYGGNIWIVDRAGGDARRITSFQGEEGAPKFSPDGKWIAFSGQYGGNIDVYLVPTFTVLRNYNAPGGYVDQLWYATKEGVKVALGNDYGGGPGDFELGIPMYEIETMATAGMTPCRLSWRRRNAPHVARLDDELHAGGQRAADVLVVRGDPYGPQALRQVRLVVHMGVVIRDEA
jgi:imidazolonepropionase-like amidohydrolase